MRAAVAGAAVAAAGLALAVGGCSPEAEAAPRRLARQGLLPAEVAERLPERRMNVVWAPEMTVCGVCNASVAKALARFANDYPDAGVVTALAAGQPFPHDLVVGSRLRVAEPAVGVQAQRPYLAILDSEGRLLGWRRIPELGRQDDVVYRELVGAYSLTVPLDEAP